MATRPRLHVTASVKLTGHEWEDGGGGEIVRYCWQSGKAHVNLLRHLT